MRSVRPSTRPLSPVCDVDALSWFFVCLVALLALWVVVSFVWATWMLIRVARGLLEPVEVDDGGLQTEP